MTSPLTQTVIGGLRRSLPTATAVLGLGLVIVLFAVPPMAPHAGFAPNPGGVPARLAPQVSYNSSTQCAGLIWAKSIPAQYQPTSCWGHDEPTMSYISNASGSGANASFQVVLPADGHPDAQGDLYATFWFGGTVYDPAGNGGGYEAFLELQFYPAAPAVTGPGSGSQDCLSYGGFNPSFSAGSNDWFACAIVWQLQNVSGSIYENAAYAGPIDAGTSSAIMVMHSHDHLFVNYSGIAQSKTVPWKISVADTTQNVSNSVFLKTGSLIISPYFSTAAVGNALYWGASNPGAIAFAYEIGHTLNTSGGFGYCAPGDGSCQGYWPGRWNSSGQIELALPKLGSGATATFPTQFKTSSSQGGEREVNATGCASPSFSTKTNCMYPFYQYRSGYASFTFGTSKVANDTNDFGNVYQFPGTLSSSGWWNGAYHSSPWGTAKFSITPANATAEFNSAGQTAGLALNATGKSSGQFMEGTYWLNVSESGCSAYSKKVYLSSGGSLSLSATIPCGGTALRDYARAVPTSGVAPAKIHFFSHAAGGTVPYSFAWSFGDGKTGVGANPYHSYKYSGTYPVTVTVTDAIGTRAISSTSASVTTPTCSGAAYFVTSGQIRECHVSQSQQVVFTLNVTQKQWNNQTYLTFYEVDGATNGTQPVFTLWTGLGGTPSTSSANQSAKGPNAEIIIALGTRAANVYGGWGTYWAIVTSPGGSGGFCFEGRLTPFAPGGGPTCHAATAPPAPSAPTAHSSPGVVAKLVTALHLTSAPSATAATSPTRARLRV